MAENSQKQAKNDDAVIPVKTGGHVTLVSLGNWAPVPAARPAGGDVDKALGLLAHTEWDEEKRARLKQIALSFFSDVRDRMEMREQLLAPWEKGGLAVDAEEATYMIGVLAAMRDGGPLPVRPAGKIPMMAQASATTAPPVPATPVPTSPTRKTLPPSPPSQGGEKPHEFAGKRREEIFAVLAKEIADEVKPQLADAALRPRLEAIIVTRFRGVRDANEIRAHMKRDAAQGGLGLPQEEIERVMAVVEDRFAKISKELLSQEKGRVLEGIKQESAAGRSQKQGTSNDIKEYEVNQWYEKRFEKAPPAAPPPAPKAVPAPPPPAPAPARSAPLPPAEVAVAAPAPRPTMQDAEYRPRLMGPIEELRSMTLDDFRRMARDPKEAARRVQDKIRLLEEEDYTQRAAAISAWRGSVPVKTYLSITRTMFDQGIGPEQAVAAQGKGSDALTLEEYNAIMELQNSLRY